MVRMENPLIGILVGAAFTALVQSSSATTGIVIVMASGGLLSLDAGIALALGANIGTCITALLASIGKPREALRASAVHILFNVLGVFLWIGLIDQLASLAVWFSPGSPELDRRRASRGRSATADRQRPYRLQRRQHDRVPAVCRPDGPHRREARPLAAHRRGGARPGSLSRHRADSTRRRWRSTACASRSYASVSG